MYELQVEKYFASAHQLVDYNGPCENLHGHNWRVQVIVAGEELDHVGMLIDFKILKGYLQEIIDFLDHKFLNDILEFSPTSEKLSKYIYTEMQKKLNKAATIKKVIVWESDTACATYYKS